MEGRRSYHVGRGGCGHTIFVLYARLSIRVALRLRSSVLIWWDRKDGSGSRRVRVTLPDAAQAQRTAQSIADAFVEARAAALIAPANLPHPEHPPFRAVVQLGLLVGVLAGGLFALVNGLRVWRLVGALGVGGAVLGLAAGSVVPNVFQGLSGSHPW